MEVISPRQRSYYSPGGFRFLIGLQVLLVIFFGAEFIIERMTQTQLSSIGFPPIPSEFGITFALLCLLVTVLQQVRHPRLGYLMVLLFPFALQILGHLLEFGQATSASQFVDSLFSGEIVFSVLAFIGGLIIFSPYIDALIPIVVLVTLLWREAKRSI